MRPAWAAAAAVVASTALGGGYLLAGGGSYAPSRTADPCLERPWTEPAGVPDLAQRIALSAFDGAGCRLGVPREELILAFRSRAELERFAARRDLDDRAAEDAVREGLERAITDAEENGAISAETARGLRFLALNVPVTLLFEILRGSSLRW